MQARETVQPRKQFTLYVNRAHPASRQVVETLVRHFEGKSAPERYLEVLDIHDNLEALEADDILVAPTLIKRWPEPGARLIGDLSDARIVEAILADVD